MKSGEKTSPYVMAVCPTQPIKFLVLAVFTNRESSCKSEIRMVLYLPDSHLRR